MHFGLAQSGEGGRGQGLIRVVWGNRHFILTLVRGGGGQWRILVGFVPKESHTGGGGSSKRSR